MNKGKVDRIIKVLLVGVLPALWTAGWAFGSYAMFKGAQDHGREAVALAALTTRAEPGRDVLLEVIAPRGPVVQSLHTQKDCVSALTSVSLSSPYTDSGGATQWKSVTVAERWVGPDVLTFATNDGLQIDVQAAAWPDRSRYAPYQSLPSELPARFGISEEELASAHDRSKGPERLVGEAHLEVSEWLLPPRARMVLVARLAPHGDRFVASPSETLGRIVLAPANSAAEYLAARRSESGSSKIGGWVFAGVAMLPALVVLVILAVRRGRRKAPGERKSEAVEERFRANLEVGDETFVCGPTPGMYRGSTVEGMSRFVKGNAALVLTEQRLVWRPVGQEAGEIALSDITNVRDEHWSLDRFDSAADSQPHVVLTLRQGGEVGFFIFRDRAEWVEALRQRARA
jgi:hypothetical protein